MLKGQRGQFIFILRFILSLALLFKPGVSKDQQNSGGVIFLQAQKNSGTVIDQLTPKASFLGVLNYERLAYSMSAAGDVNGDGLDDFLLGTFHNREEGFDAGAAYLILGRKYDDWEMKFHMTRADARFLGFKKYDAVGGCVGGPADVNGDGYDDILIGAQAGNDLVPEKPGELFIMLGKSRPVWGNYCILSKSADIRLTGELAWDDSTYRGGLAGFSIGVIGDLNGDGCDEILVGAPFFDGYRKDGGKVYLIAGRREGFSRNMLLNETAIATFCRGRDAYRAKVGYAVAGIGDVNADGLSDFMMSAPGIDQAYLLFGRAEMNWGKEFDLKNAEVVFISEAKREELGHQIEGVGDVNGDGIDDFIISAIRNRDGGTAAGKIYLILGQPGGWDSTNVNVNSAVASFIGEDTHDLAGWSIAGIGDFDGDDYNDFIIGMFNDPDRSKPGKAYLIRGRAHGWQKNQPLRELTAYFQGENKGDLCGFVVSSAGDVNGDGWDDVLISSPYNSYSRTWGGQVYLFMKERKLYKISGNVNYHDTPAPLENVIVHLSGDTLLADTTDSNAFFKFNVFEKADYALTCDFNQSYSDLRAITPYDAVLAARAALHLQQLTDSQTIAADVDQNKCVTMQDAALIFQYAIYHNSKIKSHIGEWYFTTDSLTYAKLSSNQLQQNIRGILVGDVDASWANSRPELPKLSDNTTRLTVQYQVLSNGEIHVPIFIPENRAILSIDTQIEFDPMSTKFIRIELTQLANKFQMHTHAVKGGQLHFGAFSIAYLQQGGKLAELIFQSQKKDASLAYLRWISFEMNAQKQNAGMFTFGSVKKPQKVNEYHLAQNYPNPVNPTTSINFEIANDGHVQLVIYNILGQTVRTLINKYMETGEYQFQWDGMNDSGKMVGAGLYLYQLSANNFMQIKKMVVLE